jgi:hypothetical protein
MRWKLRTRNTLRTIKEATNVGKKIERSRIPTLGGREYSTPRSIKASIDSDGPGVLYLMEHESFNALKIGISSTKSQRDRIGQHRAYGWRTVEVWSSENVQKARSIEQSVINWWRTTLNAPQAVESEKMPQGGHTETVSKSIVSKDQVLEFIYSILGDSLIRPAVKSNISDLKPGMRSIINGRVTVAVLDVRFLGSWNGIRKFQPIYRFKVNDGSGEIVVESYLSRNRAKKVDEQHVKAPAEGAAVQIEGRVISFGTDEPVLGMIDPVIFGNQVDPWSSEHRIICGNCNRKKYSRVVKRFGKRSEVYLVCSKCRMPVKVSDLH